MPSPSEMERIAETDLPAKAPVKKPATKCCHGTETCGVGDPRFKAILDEMWALHQKKAADYGTDSDLLSNLRGSEAFGIPAWLGALIRMNDKVRRLQTFARKKSLVNESVEDSLTDLACYAILALILLRESPGGRFAP